MFVACKRVSVAKNHGWRSRKINGPPIVLTVTLKLLPITLGKIGTAVQTGVSRPSGLDSNEKPTALVGQLKEIIPGLTRVTNCGETGGALGATVLVKVRNQPPARVPTSPP